MAVTSNREKPDYWCNIYLIGYMASGKTTVAKTLGTMLDVPSFDLDAIIAEVYGKPIPQIIHEIGEEGFRAIEVITLATAIGRDIVEYDVFKGAVFSCGGGTILDKVNVDSMRKTGQLIYLRTSPEEIYKRLTQEETNSEINDRPLLPADLSLASIKDMMELREPYYLYAADVIVDTDNKSPEEIAGEIIGTLNLDFNTPS